MRENKFGGFMKRKILALLLVAVMAVMALASCDVLNGLTGGEECEHTYSEKWSSDATNHWHAATCEHGENKDSLGAHDDANEDGICDTCAYEIGHEHTFESAWTVDDDSHWKKATCSHTEEKGEYDLHKDDTNDGICDVCLGHVHVLDAVGFCAGCDKEVKPVVETDLGAVVLAATARQQKINSGEIEMSYAGHSNHENSDQSMWHKVLFTLGTNGTYSKRIENQIANDGTATGKQQILEKWIPYSTEENFIGISAISVDGVYIEAMPTVYGPDDLLGYYYALSSLADGHGADQLLYAIYEMSIGENVIDLEITHDAEANKYEFSFDVFVVQISNVDGELVHNVNYFEVEVDFTYTDDYSITSLNVGTKVYTNDPGSGFDGLWVEDIDIDYDPDTNTVTFRENTYADSYTFSVTQNVGARGELSLEDSNKFVPTDFGVYTDSALTTPATSLELKNADHSKVLYIGVSPAETYLSFITADVDITVTTADGQATNGLSAILVGAEIQLFPAAAGDYIISVEALDKTVTVSVTVTERQIEIDSSLESGTFTVTSTSTYSWTNLITLKPGDQYGTKVGYYILYIPADMGIMLKSTADNNGAPEIDFQQMGYNPDSLHIVSAGYDATKGGYVAIHFTNAFSKFEFYISTRITGDFTITYAYSLEEFVVAR